MSYKQLNNDQIEHSYTQKRKIDLNLYKNELLELQKELKNLPKPKSEPDQETLEAWNEFYANPEEEKRLIERAEYVILNVMKPVYDAGKLPDKWVQPLYDFWGWLQELKK